MRHAAGLLLVLTLAACGSRGPEISTPRLAGVELAKLSGNSELCHMTLAQSDLLVQAVDDRPTSGGCGYRQAVAVAGGGADLNRPFVASCPLAAAYAIFAEEVVQPAALEHFEQPVVRLDHYGSYACRNRNGARGGQRSEHARANALDLAAFVLADGRRVTVKDDWSGGGAEEDFLHDVHRGACSVFQGVLGPEANARHHDHLHLDMGEWRFCE
jgi:hypothetical protein